MAAVTPAGWLRDQLLVQLNGLSGHLQRFWPDVRNSTWIYPGGRWQETYSDRGGNMPYWLNGVIPLAFQLRPVSDRVDSTGYNLTGTIDSYMHTLLANQRADNYSMYKMWSLGSWCVTL